MLDPTPLPRADEFIGYLVDTCHIFQKCNTKLLVAEKDPYLRSGLLARRSLMAHIILFLNMELVDRGSKKILEWGQMAPGFVLPEDSALQNLKRCMYVRRARRRKL